MADANAADAQFDSIEIRQAEHFAPETTRRPLLQVQGPSRLGAGALDEA